ncbi:hypothetical protein PG996_003874 [Apiospora saccharicola]|uniref:Uncharacterized protein n=1 Tax=Apiospora saccharicola TaxID=335842 RepID=A0ABR1W6B8_9PEZI
MVNNLHLPLEAGAGEGSSAEDWHDIFFHHVLTLDSHNAFRYLLHKAGVFPLDYPELNHWMAAACASGKFGTFKVLLDYGIPVGTPLGEKVLQLYPPSGGTPRWTAMHFALASSEPGAKKIVKCLLDMGFLKPGEGDDQSNPVDSFHEGIFPADTMKSHSCMPYNTRIATYLGLELGIAVTPNLRVLLFPVFRLLCQELRQAALLLGLDLSSGRTKVPNASRCVFTDLDKARVLVGLDPTLTRLIGNQSRYRSIHVLDPPYGIISTVRKPTKPVRTSGGAGLVQAVCESKIAIDILDAFETVLCARYSAVADHRLPYTAGAYPRSDSIMGASDLVPQWCIAS